MKKTPMEEAAKDMYEALLKHHKHMQGNRSFYKHSGKNKDDWPPIYYQTVAALAKARGEEIDKGRDDEKE